jgi:prepilin-type processing-associated H-X9-DG protein
VHRLDLILLGVLGVGLLFGLVSLMSVAIFAPRGLAERASCSNNLSQIGKAAQAYAAAHKQAWPDAFTDESHAWNEVGNTRTRDTDNGAAPQSNTVNVYVLFRAGFLGPRSCLCPSVTEKTEKAARFETLRDFAGEAYCSYSFQNQLGPYGLTSRSSINATALAVAADANPLRRDFWSGAPGGVKAGASDKRLAKKPAFVHEEWQAIPIAHAWELNSPNHEFKGQNVLYLDGHVDWTDNPYCGVWYDNIWLRRLPDVHVEPDPKDLDTLRAYDDGASYDGKSVLPADSEGDSFLVP